jgi:hypothetical protein
MPSITPARGVRKAILWEATSPRSWLWCLMLATTLLSCEGRDAKLGQAQNYFNERSAVLDSVVQRYQSESPHVKYFEVLGDEMYDVDLSINGIHVARSLNEVRLTDDTVRQSLVALSIPMSELLACRSMLETAGCISIHSLSLEDRRIVIRYRRYMMSGVYFIKDLRPDGSGEFRGRKLSPTWTLQWGSPGFDGSHHDVY